MWPAWRKGERMEDVQSTLTPVPARARPGSNVSEAQLFLLLQADKPLLDPRHYDLSHVDTVEFGRATPEAAEGSALSDRRLSIHRSDGLMSKNHALLRRVIGHWMIEDQHSKNGTRVNGAPVESAILGDSDVIELGQTFLLFRFSASTPMPAVPGLRGFATWVPSLWRAASDLAAVARSTVPVCLRGESGTGKELLATAIHEASGRAGRFVPVNCGALPANLVESELFGYRKGAFSGADEDRIGLIRSSSGGTLFLDEVGDLPLPAQAALLRVFQEKEVVPVGETRAFHVDLRLITATHRDLESMAADGWFRTDLLARLTGFGITLPPLRQRREDLGLLITALLRRLARDRADRVVFSRPAARALVAYEWPMNVRELERALEVALVLARDGPVELEHLPEPLRAPRAPADRAPATAVAFQQDRREHLTHLLREHAGNVSAVARLLGKTRAQIHRWIKRYQLDPRSFRR
jgi:sigma-54 dependent transcriptional regulator, acetoin dehydrogenase operon transcriptional activator AcoR